MSTSYLSRKFVLSLFIGLVGTLFMARHFITPTQWQWCMMVTVVSYIASVTIQKNRVEVKEPGKLKAKYRSKSKFGRWIEDIIVRIKGMFTKDFLLAALLFYVASHYRYKEVIPGDVWFAISSALAACYNIGNPFGKTNG